MTLSIQMRRDLHGHNLHPQLRGRSPDLRGSAPAGNCLLPGVSEPGNPALLPQLRKTPMTHSNNYPFLTKAQIAERLSVEDDFVLQATLILTGRQTEDELQVRETRHKNRTGWMSSHAVFGTKMSEKVSAGETLSDEEVTRLRGMVCHYGRQLAAHFRAEAVRENPALTAVARLFSAG